MSCKVCKKETKRFCKLCRTLYCSKDCQRLDWNNHKNECVEFPLSYMDQYQKGVYWICDYDDKNNITSVFFKTGEEDRHTAYLPNLKEVCKQRDMLIDNGWVKVKKPEITFS